MVKLRDISLCFILFIPTLPTSQSPPLVRDHSGLTSFSRKVNYSALWVARKVPKVGDSCYTLAREATFVFLFIAFTFNRDKFLQERFCPCRANPFWKQTGSSDRCSSATKKKKKKNGGLPVHLKGKELFSEKRRSLRRRHSPALHRKK